MTTNQNPDPPEARELPTHHCEACDQFGDPSGVAQNEAGCAGIGLAATIAALPSAERVEVYRQSLEKDELFERVMSDLAFEELQLLRGSDERATQAEAKLSKIDSAMGCWRGGGPCTPEQLLREVAEVLWPEDYAAPDGKRTEATKP